MRGLHLYGQRFDDAPALSAAAQAAEIFLVRRLFQRRSDGTVMNAAFTQLHYPTYWHYDILFALKVMGEMGRLHDPRCADALDRLQSKQLADGGWPAEARYYTASTATPRLHADLVDWSGTSPRRHNPWVTVDALAVMHQAGRLQAAAALPEHRAGHSRAATSRQPRTS